MLQIMFYWKIKQHLIKLCLIFCNNIAFYKNHLSILYYISIWESNWKTIGTHFKITVQCSQTRWGFSIELIKQVFSEVIDAHECVVYVNIFSSNITTASLRFLTDVITCIRVELQFDSWVIIKCIGVRRCAGCIRRGQEELKVDALLANLNFIEMKRGKNSRSGFDAVVSIVSDNKKILLQIIVENCCLILMCLLFMF